MIHGFAAFLPRSQTCKCRGSSVLLRLFFAASYSFAQDLHPNANAHGKPLIMVGTTLSDLLVGNTFMPVTLYVFL